MNWGIKVKKYLEDGNKCKYYGDKACPCVSNKDIRKQYDKRGDFGQSEFHFLNVTIAPTT